MAGVTTAVEVMACPFEWGRSDCCTAVADVVQRLCGRDVMDGIRGLYHDRASAHAAITRHGGFEAWVAAQAVRLGLTPIAPQTGAAGDVGIAGDGVLAVCVAPGWWMAKSRRGVVIHASPRIARAWRV